MKNLVVSSSGTELEEYVTVKDSDVESDDEMDMDDPLWNDNDIRKQFVESSMIRVDKIDPVWFFGKGKVEEIAVAISRMPPRFVFINCSLTQTQMKQLEASFYGGLLSYLSAKKQAYLETSRPRQMVGYRGDDEAEKYEQRISTYLPKSIEVFDRSRMILEIFAVRANSPIAKLQVDLAKMHFTRTNLGSGNLRKSRDILNSLQTMTTPFREVRITTDDGVKVDNSQYSFSEHKEKVDTLMKKLSDKMKLHKEHQRAHRERRKAHVSIGLVGYTNSGKTSILNQLTNKNLRVRNILFQTLESATKDFTLPNGMHVHVTDSVGFVRDLPHFLFQAFQTTIDELIDSDFIIHVCDAAHPLAEDQIEAVRKTLMDAGMTQRDLDERIVQVWNKIDEVTDIEQLVKDKPNCLYVSAKTGEGIDLLINVIEKVAKRISKVERIKIEFPLSHLNSRMKVLRDIANVVYDDTLDCDESGENMSVDVLISPDALEKYKHQI